VCFLRPLVAGPFLEKLSGAKLRVFFGHDNRIYTEIFFEARQLVCSFTTTGYAIYPRCCALIGEQPSCPLDACACLRC